VAQTRTDFFLLTRHWAAVLLLLAAVLLPRPLGLLPAALPAGPQVADSYRVSQVDTVHHSLKCDASRWEASGENACCAATPAGCADHCGQSGALVQGGLMAPLPPTTARPTVRWSRSPEEPVFSRYRPPDHPRRFHG